MRSLTRGLHLAAVRTTRADQRGRAARRLAGSKVGEHRGALDLEGGCRYAGGVNALFGLVDGRHLVCHASREFGCEGRGPHVPLRDRVKDRLQRVGEEFLLGSTAAA